MECLCIGFFLLVVVGAVVLTLEPWKRRQKSITVPVIDHSRCPTGTVCRVYSEPVPIDLTNKTDTYHNYCQTLGCKYLFKVHQGVPPLGQVVKRRRL